MVFVEKRLHLCHKIRDEDTTKSVLGCQPWFFWPGLWVLLFVLLDAIYILCVFTWRHGGHIWCPKTMKRRPCLCPKPVLLELNSFLMQTLCFVPINLLRCWPREWKYRIFFFDWRKLNISAPLRSTTWIRKTIRFILAVSAEQRRYNNTLCNVFYYIQTCGGKTRTELSDSLHGILSEQRPEKNLPEKTSVRKKTRQEIWVGSMAHALKSPSYEGYTAGRTLPLFTKQVFQQRTANSK